MATGPVGLSAVCDIIIYKDGLTINRENFPVFFNSISRVVASVKVEQMAQIKIDLTPSMEDALTILASGVLGSSTGQAGQLPKSASGGGTKSTVSATAVSPSAIPAGGGDAPQSAKSNMPYYAVRFSWPNEDDGDTDWYGGFAACPDISLNGTEISISVNIVGQHSLMQMNQGPKVYKNESALDVITKLADTFGIDIVFDEEDGDTLDILKAGLVNGQFNENGLNIIRRICLRFRCYFMADSSVTGSKARYIIKSTSFLHDQPPQFHFVVFRQVQPELNVIPCFSFEIISKGTLFIPGHTFGIFSRAVLSSTKEVKKDITNSSSVKSTSTSGSKSETGAFPVDTGDGSEKGGATGRVDNSDPEEAGAHHHGVGNKEQDTNDILAARSELARSEQIKFRIETQGLPRVQPLTMAQLTVGPGEKGIEAFSGPCKIDSVEHVWDGTGGWASHLEITKTGSATSIDIKEKPSQAPAAPDSKVTKKPKGF